MYYVRSGIGFFDGGLLCLYEDDISLIIGAIFLVPCLVSVIWKIGVDVDVDVLCTGTFGRFLQIE